MRECGKWQGKNLILFNSERLKGIGIEGILGVIVYESLSVNMSVRHAITNVNGM